MVIQPHDLLKLKKENQLMKTEGLPEWLSRSVSDVRFVVVRREPIVDGNIPIGVRGKSRNERFGTFIPFDDIIECVTPEQLAAQRKWKSHPHYDDYDLFQSLDLVESILQKYRLLWGPTGSVGFQLASGQHTVTETSDLDIIIRANEIPINMAESIISEFQQAKVRIDPLIEMQHGAVSLIEYSKQNQPFLIRTLEGPKLITIV
ncbi:malonate decarboxylase holo-ACP synthase [Alkalihalobacillus sp. TS-13]|uniref:malonate decarboxylase holo-ACP synthase n=1 Tax=Alkalihalobacillus sp. TS-13 TaxID=2842455 RepID=UPI001C877296|nr:malonate decarboxylase holo-ACP synthase [Alkalihalobacillus sp. TS-13]